MRVVCINDSNKPNEIPNSMWILKGQVYTVVKVMKCNIQGGILGFELEEKKLVDCDPYKYYSADRFAPVVEDGTPSMRQEEVLEEVVV